MKEPPLAFNRKPPPVTPIIDPDGNWGVIHQTSHEIYPEVRPVENRNGAGINPPELAPAAPGVPSARFDVPRNPVRDVRHDRAASVRAGAFDGGAPGAPAGSTGNGATRGANPLAPNG
jgi:hypothetical protein